MNHPVAIQVPRWRILLLALLTLGAMGILLVRLWNVQLRDEREVGEKIRRETTVTERLSPARGSIVDRNGVPLAENKASFDVDFYLEEMVRQYKHQHHGVVPEIGVRRKQGKKTVDRREPNLGEITKDGAEQLSKILGIKVELNAHELQEHYYQTPTIPYQYCADINFATLARFSEHNLGLPGIDISVRPIRYYNYGAMAAHLLGYVGKPSDQAASPDGHELESVGKVGVEAEFDAQLQGQPGGRSSRINHKGYIVGQESYNPPTVGNSLLLTIDARIQYICEQVMREAGRGCAVVMDPNNGDILAMVSVPSFDPNAFYPKLDVAKWKSWNRDTTAPLLNRAIGATYAPGSTFKVLVAAAALKSGTISPNTVFDCPPSITIGNHVFHDHSGLPDGAGPITVHDAIRLSCNVFFYKLGIATGIDNIDRMGQLVGFGEQTGIPLSGEQKGVLPGPDWLKEHYAGVNWTTAYTANTAIGQGNVLVTPLQMAVLASTMANGGTVYRPRLTLGVTNAAGEEVVSVPPLVRNVLGLAPEQITAIREAMLAVVTSGTGHNTVPLAGVDIAGKSGSAQHTRRVNGEVIKDTTTWFISFAPYQKPRYTVVVMVEGGVAGGATAGPLVHQIYEQIFNMESSGVNPKLTYLTPAIGSYSGTTSYTPPAPEMPSTPTASRPAADAPPVAAPEAATGGLPMDADNENDNGSMTPTTNRRSSNRAFSR